MMFVETVLPAGHTFGTYHDATVGVLTGAGFNFHAVNLPTMPPAYVFAVGAEIVNLISRGMGALVGQEVGVPFPHTH